MCNPMDGASVSQFWHLLNVRDDFRDLVKFSIGNCALVRFCVDWCVGDGPLAVSFPILFSFVSSPLASIAVGTLAFDESCLL